MYRWDLTQALPRHVSLPRCSINSGGDVFLFFTGLYTIVSWLSFRQVSHLMSHSVRMSAWGCLDPSFSNNPCRSPVIGHSPSLHSCFVPNKQTSHLSNRKGKVYYKQIMEAEVVLELVLYVVPGGNTPKIAVAETWPSSFRAMHLYVPESIWLATSICSQLESSYFWGPPRDCRTNGEMKSRGGYWKKHFLMAKAGWGPYITAEALGMLYPGMSGVP